MKTAVLYQTNNPAGKPSGPAASSNRTTIAPVPSRAGVTKSPWAFYLTQGASFVSMKLITERASTTAPVFQKIRDERYEVYAHGGLND